MAIEVTGTNGNSKREDRAECRETLTTKTQLIKELLTNNMPKSTYVII